MNILNNINNIQNVNMSNTMTDVKPEIKPEIKLKEQAYKPDVFDFLSEKVVNKNDLNDMVTTPRAIFKGYLCFTVGTMINTVAGFIKNEKLANPLKVVGILTSILGTYNFVKPYLIRSDKLTESGK